MFTDLFLKPRIVFAPEAEAGTGDDATADTAADTSADTATDTAAETTTADAAATPRWWEGDGLNENQRAQLTALGLTVDDPVQAVAKLTDMEASAKRKLGKPADQLIERPGKDQDIADWMRKNGEMFGIPDAPDKYDVARPETWPKDAKWNDPLEQEARKIAHEEGITGKGLNRMIGLYAGAVAKLDADAREEMTAANNEMMAALQKDWGSQTEARLALASQAASVIAEKAGLDATAMENLAMTLKPKIGDAGTIRLFAALGEMMGDDSIVAASGGTGGFSTTPAEARQKLDAYRKPGGEYYEAVAKSNRAEMDRLKPEIERLTKLAAG